MALESSFSHPRFTRVYGAVAATGERLGYGRWRRAVLDAATGRLLVLGLGPGHDLAHLPPAVTQVVAVEPDPAMRAAARPRVAACPVPVALLSADAQALPLAAACVDTVLCACVLCSVTSPPTALAEVRRVLAPNGALLLLEHVAAPPGHWLGPVQRLVTPVWSRAAGGCSVRRDTLAEVEAAGFDVGAVRSVVVRSNLLPVAPHVMGSATPLTQRDAA